MSLFKRKEPKIEYDPKSQTPAVRSSICTGEKVAGFIDNTTGQFKEYALITNQEELLGFCKRAGVSSNDLKEIY